MFRYLCIIPPLLVWLNLFVHLCKMAADMFPSVLLPAITATKLSSRIFIFMQKNNLIEALFKKLVRLNSYGKQFIQDKEINRKTPLLLATNQTFEYKKTTTHTDGCSGLGKVHKCSGAADDPLDNVSVR